MLLLGLGVGRGGGGGWVRGVRGWVAGGAVGFEGQRARWRRKAVVGVREELI